MTKKVETFVMTNVEAMQALKKGEFEGSLVQVSTDEYGVTTVTVTSDE